ncbi:MAG: hypothetical protein U0414_24365 [Polyangiaceae bacterium]
MPRLSARNLTLACALTASAACASEGPRRRHHTPEVEPSASAGPAPLGPWPRFSELPSYAEAGYASHSAHRLGDDAATLLRSGAANPTLDGEQPSGAVLVAALATARDAPANEYFVMEKGGEGATPEAGGWSFLVVGPDGQMRARGALPLCVRCHQEAGPSLVFPAPGPIAAPSK